jgi:transposase InsO family protein
VPSVSTVARILKRNGCIDPAAATTHQPCRRFERAKPNELWQMDFKGHFAMTRGGRCHPLTLLDDHSRYLLGLRACSEETTTVVRAHLTDIFRCYGLPEQILCDNGPPWSGSGPELSALAVWLMRLGIRPIHGRPHHPQTQGKDERFHRTLKYELLCRADWLDLPHTQPRFDAYRQDYNHHRPHEALQLDCPVSRYQISSRPFPENLPVPQYHTGELVRRVKSKGEITVHNRFFYIGRAFIGLPVALRPCNTHDSCLRVCLGAIALGRIDPKAPLVKPKGNYYPMLPLKEKL